MISYQVYLLLHLLGIFLILIPLGGITLHIINGGTRDFGARRLAGITHGIGLLITLVAGFGLLARLGIVNGLPGWIYVKLLVWLALGAMPFFIYRKKELGKVFWVTVFVLAGLAGYMAIYKPSFSAASQDVSAPAFEEDLIEPSLDEAPVLEDIPENGPENGPENEAANEAAE